MLLRMDIFGDAHGLGEVITHPTMMKLGTVIPYLKKMQKIYESRDTSPEFCSHQYFSQEINKLSNIKKYRYRLHFGT